MSAKRQAAALLVVLLVALGFRLVAHSEMARAGDQFFPVIDSEAYLLQALRVPAGEDIVEGVYYQAPLYPYLLGVTLWAAGVPGDVHATSAVDLDPALLERALSVGRGLNLVLGMLFVLVTFLLGRRLVSPGGGLWAALLAALHGPSVFYEGHLLKVSLSLLVLPLVVLACLRAERARRTATWMLPGVLLGLGGLVRGNIHLLVGLALLALCIAGLRRHALGLRARQAAFLLLGFALALAPVVVRNTLVAGRPVLATAAGGTAFYLCNHAGNDTGLVEHLRTNRQTPRYEFDDWKRSAEAATGRRLTPAEISSYWFDRALAEIAADPLRWVRLELRKLGLLFSRYEAPDNTLFALGAEACPALRLTPVDHGLLVPLALAGGWLLLRRRRLEPGPSRVPFVLALLGYAASLLLFNMTSRFRMPVASLAVVPAGYLLARVPLLAARGDRARPAAVVAVLAAGWLLGLVSEGPLGPLDAGELAGHRMTRFLNAAQLAVARDDLDTARDELERAVSEGAAVDKASPDVLAALADVERRTAYELFDAGDVAGAKALRATAAERARAGVQRFPGHGPLLFVAGLLAFEDGAWADAERLLRAALVAVPGHEGAPPFLLLALLAQGNTSAALEVCPLVEDVPTLPPELALRLASALDGAAQRAPEVDAAALRSHAQRLLATALADPSTRARALHQQGMLLYGGGQPAAAATSFREALASSPDDREARTYLTLALLAGGRPSEARLEAERLVADGPQLDDGHGLLALALVRLGEVDGARAALSDYDRLVAQAEAAGRPRRLPELPEFAALRAAP